MRMTYHLTFTFKDSKREAEEFCNWYNADLSKYELRKGYIATAHEWESRDGKTKKWLCYHYYKA